jgi:hypothetical protein
MYCYDPPMTMEEAWAPIDEIAGTGVDTFVYGSGDGPTMLHDTQVGEVRGARLETFSQAEPSILWGLSSWRAYENIMSLIDRGLDPMKVLLDRAHDKGLEFFASLRMAHNSDPKDADIAHNGQFKIDHPEWCLRGRGKYNFNWVHPQVRAERLGLIDETVNRYDIEGLEVDWVFNPFFFQEGEVEQNSHILTEFMRDARRSVDKAAQKRGRPMALGARVLPTLDGNLAAGLDVATWIREDLLDFVVPNLYIDNQVDADFPFEWLVDLAHETKCEVYPCLQSRVWIDAQDRRTRTRWEYSNTITIPREHPASVEHYRAGAAAYWSKGADALYLPWFAWPVGAEQRQVLSEIHDPDVLREKPKHYVARRHHDEAASQDYTAELPITLTTGLDAPGQTVHVFVADDPDRGEARLMVRLMGSTTHDSLTVSLNGRALPSETCRRKEYGGYLYAWLEYPLGRGTWRKGRNDVAVALHSRPANLTVPVLLESVELIVTYPGPEAA